VSRRVSSCDDGAMPRWLAAVALALLAVLACRSPEEKLVDRRNELRRALDGLYADYGRSDAEPAKGDAAAPADAAGAAPAGIVGRFVGQLEQTHFDETCLAVGRGERPFVLSDRLAAFVADGANADRCRRAARIQAEVAALEREVAQRERPAP
jgi:hypothetical protein